MGFAKDLVNAAFDSIDQALADSWLEAIGCHEFMPGELVAIGHRIKTKRSNNNGSPDVITDGSYIFVGPNMSVLMVENGEITQVFSEAGQNVFHSKLSKGFFTAGGIGEGVRTLSKDAGERFTFGGVKAVVQKAYYVNQREIMGNEFASDKIPVRIHIPDINYDVDCNCQLQGMYSFRVGDPVAFYKNFVGNAGGSFFVNNIASLINSFILTGVQPAIARLFAAGTRPSGMVEYVELLAKAICEETTKALGPERGIEIASCAISSFVLEGADMHYLTQFERNAALKDPTMAAAHLTSATADAVQRIAYQASTEGAPTGYALIGAQLLKQREAMGIKPEVRKHYWRCNCGKYVSGKFCGYCGQKELFECKECGAVDTGKFCPHCGTKLHD